MAATAIKRWSEDNRCLISPSSVGIRFLDSGHFEILRSAAERAKKIRINLEPTCGPRSYVATIDATGASFLGDQGGQASFSICSRN